MALTAILMRESKGDRIITKVNIIGEISYLTDVYGYKNACLKVRIKQDRSMIGIAIDNAIIVSI
jgi:hypothetical protein